MTRVAFSLFGDGSWTGGLNYLRNVFSALGEVPGRPVTPVLFVAPSAPAEAVRSLAPYLSESPVVVPGWSGEWWKRGLRVLAAAGLQRDLASLAAFRKARIDLVFQNDAWYGFGFPVRTLAWIPDFQHCRLPQMFGPLRRLKRRAAFTALTACATRILVSSEDARQDCEHFFPRARGRVSVAPFCVKMDDHILAQDVRSTVARLEIPGRYIYFPAQLWRHKNHLQVLEALHLLKNTGSDILVVSSGGAADRRNPDYPALVLAQARERGLEANIRFLGMIPYRDVVALMRGAVAVLNPSLFEGWSTTVEEAKALGVPLVLSSLRVHLEQAGDVAAFFDPDVARSMADAMASAWRRFPAGPDPAREQLALAKYGFAREEFGRRFAAIVSEAAGA